MLGLIVILRVGQRLKVGKSDGARLEAEHADEPFLFTFPVTRLSDASNTI